MGNLRIIAGELRGRRILVPPGTGVRPTAERIREALFSIVAPSLPQARVLDAYSGSGAFAFEALSRGAQHVVLIESDRQALSYLRRNASDLGVTHRCTFLQGGVLDLLRGGRASGPFDIVLADPPYASGQAEDFVAAAAPLLAPGGLIVLEREARTEPAWGPQPQLLQLRSRRYGRACLDIFRRTS